MNFQNSYMRMKQRERLWKRLLEIFMAGQYSRITGQSLEGLEPQCLGSYPHTVWSLAASYLISLCLNFLIHETEFIMLLPHDCCEARLQYVKSSGCRSTACLLPLSRGYFQSQLREQCQGSLKALSVLVCSYTRTFFSFATSNSAGSVTGNTSTVFSLLNRFIHI